MENTVNPSTMSVEPFPAARRVHSAPEDRSGLSADERARIIRRLRRLAWWLDSSITIPGTRLSFGLDPIVGLAPGIGDAVMLAASLYILYEGKRLGASDKTLAQMGANVLIDAVAGAVPVLGDLVDAGFKANQRNLRLLGIEPIASGESPPP